MICAICTKRIKSTESYVYSRHTKQHYHLRHINEKPKKKEGE